MRALPDRSCVQCGGIYPAGTYSAHRLTHPAKISERPVISPESLSAVEAEVLQRLAASRMTVSAVKLAAEMFGDFDGKLLNHDVTFDFVEYILRGLNAAGLITYRLGVTLSVGETGTVEMVEGVSKDSVPVYIRVTDSGFRAIGYTTKVSVAGTRRSYRGEDAKHPGDGTDFRNQPFMAVGFGEIERCLLAEHLNRYPEHRFATPGGF